MTMYSILLKLGLVIIIFNCLQSCTKNHAEIEVLTKDVQVITLENFVSMGLQLEIADDLTDNKNWVGFLLEFTELSGELKITLNKKKDFLPDEEHHHVFESKNSFYRIVGFNKQDLIVLNYIYSSGGASHLLNLIISKKTREGLGIRNRYDFTYSISHFPEDEVKVHCHPISSECLTMTHKSTSGGGRGNGI